MHCIKEGRGFMRRLLVGSSDVSWMGEVTKGISIVKQDPLPSPSEVADKVDP